MSDLESMVAEGLTASEIARRLGCTPQNVAQRLKRAGLKASKDPARRKPREKGEQKVRVSGRVSPAVARWANGKVSDLLTEAWEATLTVALLEQLVLQLCCTPNDLFAVPSPARR